MTLSLLDFLFPRICHICGGTLSGSERFICNGCTARLPRTLYHRRPDNPMEQRFAGLFTFEKASGVFFYSANSELAGVIHDFKYHRFPDLAVHMGCLMATELLTTSFLSDIDVILPVPMHWWKQARRGYNQSVMLARGISQVSGIPVCNLLKAIHPHRTQTSLTHAQRIDNTSGIFQLTHPDTLKGKHLLILDDVCTTGATLTSAALAILAEIPDARISLLSLAVTF